MTRIHKPLLEISILTKQMEHAMMDHMLGDLGLSEDEAKKVMQRSKKNGSFDRKLKQVVEAWWSN
jgi:hypothetical protein